MRASFSDQTIMRDPEGLFLGISLGYDHCAEHEWGIRQLLKSLCVPTDPEIHGIPKRTVGKFQKDKLRHYKGVKYNKQKVDILVFKDHYYENDTDLLLRSLPMFYLEDKSKPHDLKIATAWDEGSFAIAVVEDDHKHILQLLYNAFLKEDACIGLSHNVNPFANSGLNIMIVSAIPKEILDIVYETDQNHFSLMKDFKATGIEEKLKQAGKDFFALQPERVGKSDESGKVDKTDTSVLRGRKTAYDLIFWLNPMNQQDNNCGWFTVEELEQWINNSGPIPKK